MPDDDTTPKCNRCGGPMHYVKDVDHDEGTCEVYDCDVCGHRMHFELPD